MTRRKLNPLTFRGLGLTTNGRTAYLEYDDGGYSSPRHDAIDIERQGNFPSFLRLQPEGKTFPLHIAIKSSAKQIQFNALAKIFDPTLGEGFLILEDLSCFPAQRYRFMCAPEQLIVDQRTDSSLIVPLFAANPILEDIDADSQVDDIDSGVNPVTMTLINDGTYPSDRLTLSAIADGAKLPAEGYTELIEIVYTNRSEFSLTGPGSGTWMLMVIEGWDTATKVTAGEMTSDGRDIAVFVDGVQVPPEKVTLADFDTASTKVWIEISDSPAQFGELKFGIVPGDTTFTFLRADHGFLPGDYLVFVDTTGVNIEQIRVTSVNGSDIVVQRGLRNTTAVTTIASRRVYKSGHHIQLAWNYTDTPEPLPARPTNPDPPLINTSTSDNLHWDWTTSPMWPDNNRRAGGFRRIVYNGRDDIPELRKNRMSAKTTLRAVGVTASFEDVEPTALQPNFDALEFTACCGIDDTAGDIEYDASLGWPFALQIIGRDLLGYDSIIFNRVGHETPSVHFPPRIYTNQTETPPGILSAVIFRARNMITTSTRPPDSAEESLTPVLTIGEDSQRFVIDEETLLIGIVARMRDAADTADGATVAINEVDTNGAPDVQIIGPFSGAGSLGTSFRPVCFFPSPAAAFTTDVPVMAAGEYHLGMVETDVSGQDIRVPRSDASIYSKGEHWDRPTTVTWQRQAAQDLWFAILSLNSDNQEEVLQQERTGEVLTIDDISLTFDPDRTPLLRVPKATIAASEEAAYYFDTIWEMNSETIRLRWLQRTADLGANGVLIDVHEHTVIEEKFNDNIRSSVEISGDPWLEAVSGSNILTITALDGAQDERQTVGIRSTWLA